MLSVFAPATLQVLLEKLTDFGISAYKSVTDVETKLQKLKRSILSVQSAINDADDKIFTDRAWQFLLQDVEEVAYDADDLLDEITVEISKAARGRRKQKNKVINKLFLSLFKRTSAPNMNEIQEKLDTMLGEIVNLSLRELNYGRYHNNIESSLQTSSLTDESRIFGRDDDRTNLIAMLVTSEESSRGGNVSVIPIVGMVGVGKTTVAQLLYNHDYQREMPHPFNVKMWVSITGNFNVMAATRSMIEEAKRGSTSLSNLELPHLSNLNSLQLILTEILGEKKFLLILDNLWNVRRIEWDLFLEPLKPGLKGSKIVVTTGSHEVSSLIRPAGAYFLNCLSEHDCWLLLRHEALGDVELNRYPELEAIGKKIATKCKGLPLAAKFLGSSLYRKVNEDEWKMIQDSKIWDLTIMEKEIFPVLKSGYHRLPSHVRQCFAYCSLFPSSYGFEKKKLVRMWLGEGFILPDKERKINEDIGSTYFDQLLHNSFFQMDGESYKMHDAVHGLAQSFSGEKFLSTDKTDDSLITKKTRHLSLVSEKILMQTLNTSSAIKRLRTLLVLHTIQKVSPTLFMRLRSLRVLDMSGTHIEVLTGGIGNLKHLRFLDLSNTFLASLPETVHKLFVLQTLRLVNCSKLLYLPECIGKLESLQHLELARSSKLTSMPSGIGKLTGLQTVSEFIIGPKKGQMKELKDMNNIRGSLCIKQLEMVNNRYEARETKLANKKHLKKLELQWTFISNAGNAEDVLNELMIPPHGGLKELVLIRYGGTKFPPGMGDPLFSELESISLHECQNCGLVPSLGELPKLKFLKIVGMNELITVGESFHGYERLETLELCCMPKLERWNGLRDNDMARLRKLTIAQCPLMVALPSLHYLLCLKELKLEDCPVLESLSEERLPESVKYLSIARCGNSENRCNGNQSDDWSKIAHIPRIEINYIKMQY